MKLWHALTITAAGIAVVGTIQAITPKPVSVAPIQPLAVSTAPVEAPSVPDVKTVPGISIITPIAPQAQPDAAPTDYSPSTTYVVNPATVTPVTEPATATPPTPQQVTQTQKDMLTLEVVNPIDGKGIVDGREYVANPNGDGGDLNSVHIGLVVRDLNGNPINTDEVTVTATDKSQNVVMEGTGTTYMAYINGQPVQTWYYPFNYEFKTPGVHTIQFSDGSVKAQPVVINVAAAAQ